MRKEVRLEPPPDGPMEGDAMGGHAVKMAVSIAKGGEVSAVRIIEGAGQPFDDLAKAAMYRFLFEPGRSRDDRPLACEITYRYIFIDRTQRSRL